MNKVLVAVMFIGIIGHQSAWGVVRGAAYAIHHLAERDKQFAGVGRKCYRITPGGKFIVQHCNHQDVNSIYSANDQVTYYATDHTCQYVDDSSMYKKDDKTITEDLDSTVRLKATSIEFKPHYGDYQATAYDDRNQPIASVRCFGMELKGSVLSNLGSYCDIDERAVIVRRPAVQAAPHNNDRLAASDQMAGTVVMFGSAYGFARLVWDGAVLTKNVCGYILGKLVGKKKEEEQKSKPAQGRPNPS